MKTRVLDSWPILEWIKGGNDSTEFVDSLLSEAEDGNARLLMSVINAGEVYYFLMKHHSAQLAASWRDLARTLPVTIDVPAAEDVWRAASLKGQFAISYADAFAAALARKHNCPLVTGDEEFRGVADLNIEWLQRP